MRCVVDRQSTTSRVKRDLFVGLPQNKWLSRLRGLGACQVANRNLGSGGDRVSHSLNVLCASLASNAKRQILLLSIEGRIGLVFCRRGA